MPNPATIRKQRLRKTKAQLIDEIDTLEQRAAAKDDQLRVALDNMPGGLVYTDEELNLVVCKDGFADIYQAPRELLQPGCPYPNYLRYLAEHGYYGEGDVDAIVADCATPRTRPSKPIRRTDISTSSASAGSRPAVR